MQQPFLRRELQEPSFGLGEAGDGAEGKLDPGEGGMDPVGDFRVGSSAISGAASRNIRSRDFFANTIQYLSAAARAQSCLTRFAKMNGRAILRPDPH